MPLLATNGVRYATAYDREILDVFTAIRHHTTWNMRAACSRVNQQRHLRDAREMTDRFSDLPQAIANTVALSERLEFELHDLGYEFPRYPVPEGETMDSFLHQRYGGRRHEAIWR